MCAGGGSIAKAYREADGAHSIICFRHDSEMVLLSVMPLQLQYYFYFP